METIQASTEYSMTPNAIQWSGAGNRLPAKSQVQPAVTTMNAQIESRMEPLPLGRTVTCTAVLGAGPGPYSRITIW